MKPVVIRRPFTDLERDRALALGKARMPGASFSRRFAKDISDVAATRPEFGITDKQAEQLTRLCWTFRRQLAAHVVPEHQPPETQKAAMFRQFTERLRLELYMAKHAPNRPMLSPTNRP